MPSQSSLWSMRSRASSRETLTLIRLFKSSARQVLLHHFATVSRPVLSNSRGIGQRLHALQRSITPVQVPTAGDGRQMYCQWFDSTTPLVFCSLEEIMRRCTRCQCLLTALFSRTHDDLGREYCTISCLELTERYERYQTKRDKKAWRRPVIEEQNAPT